MTLLARLLVLAGPILLLVMTAIAGYAYSQIHALSLPIPEALGLFTVLLPFITGISTQGAYGLIKRSRNAQSQLTLPLIAVISFQLIYETIIATLALTNILPPSSLGCGLESKWQKLFSDKNTDAIRAIQDKFNCCGFNSVYDRAWPFKNPALEPGNCVEAFGRSKSCFREWRGAQQFNAGLFLLVAVIVFVLKIVAIIYLLASFSWIHPSLARPFKKITRGDIEDSPEDNRATMRRLIEGGDGDEEYRDDVGGERSERPAAAANGSGQEQGPRVEPSQLVDDGNQWRDNEERH